MTVLKPSSSATSFIEQSVKSLDFDENQASQLLMELLKKNVTEGKTDVDDLRRFEEHAPLRESEAFQELLEQAESRSKAEAESASTAR